MSRVKCRGNKATELVLLTILQKHRITGWRRHLQIVGQPDFAFPKYRVAVFVDGCFWHGCPHHSSIPASNVEFWTKKINVNRTRDRLVNRELRKKGWVVLRVWQHELHDESRVLRRLKAALGKDIMKA